MSTGYFYLEWGPLLYEVWSSHSVIAEHRNLQECHAVSFGISRRFEGPVPSKRQVLSNGMAKYTESRHALIRDFSRP
jgi:hypothetical protein